MSQMTFSDYEYSCRKKKTKREEFLDVMEDMIPWDEWVEFVRPYYPSGKRGRPMMKGGTIVDATIINAPSSTKNKEKTRDPEMHQTKKR